MYCRITGMWARALQQSAKIRRLINVHFVEKRLLNLILRISEMKFSLSHLIIELLTIRMTRAAKTMKPFMITLELTFIGELSIISMKSSLPADTSIGIFFISSQDFFPVESFWYDCWLS